MKNHEEVIQYILSFMNLEKGPEKYSERTYRLDRMFALARALGNPQNSFKTIHVAGSKGKGSTSALLANAIQAAGYKTGLYTSPHVRDYRERFTLCGNFFDEDILVRVGNRLADGTRDFEFEGMKPTAFELFTMYAFMLFEESGCDWAVIETGMGGRLDATNIITPQAGVITPIELEHTRILGDTIEKIAFEKSKIIKPAVPVFISRQKPQALDVLLEEAKACRSPVHCLGKEVRILDTVCTPSREQVDIELEDGYRASLKLSMMGEAQAGNCALALMVLRNLGLYKQGVTEKALEKTTLPGHFQRIEKYGRAFYIDGAHTKLSMELLMKSWKQLFGCNTGACIFGCVADKNHTEMENLILSTFDRVAVSRPGTFKESAPEALFAEMRDLAQSSFNTCGGYRTCSSDKKKTVVLKTEAQDAINWAVENTKENESILVCGSFYLAGDILEALCH